MITVYIGKKRFGLIDFIKLVEEAGFIINLDYELKPVFSNREIADKLKSKGEKLTPYKIKRVKAEHLTPVPYCDDMREFLKAIALEEDKKMIDDN